MTIDHWKAQLRGLILGELLRLVRLNPHRTRRWSKKGT